MIGVSMISPDGLAIRPRMPASCRICCGRAARARVGHDVDRVERRRSLLLAGLASLISSSVPISFIISSATCSATCAQMSTTLL